MSICTRLWPTSTAVRLGLLALLGVALSACAPVYETRYSLTPPAADAPERTEALACIEQCGQQQQVCLVSAREAFENCELRAQTQFSHCRMRERMDYLACRGPYGRTSCFPSTCLVPVCETNIQGCEAGYRACYAACGGTVTEETVCVANCDGEDAAATVEGVTKASSE
ncbi:MAG: hypothetical protein ACFB3T_09230 [Geminicoccaceae bacterium]